MSENQQPLTEEEQAVPSAEPMEPDLPEAVGTGESTLPAETDADLPAEDEAEDAEIEDREWRGDEYDEALDDVCRDIDPADVKIFGMPRVCFHSAAFGVAGGYILCGLLGLAGIPAPSPTVCAIACAVVGYFIGKYFDKKRLAAKEAEAAAEAADGAE